MAATATTGNESMRRAAGRFLGAYALPLMLVLLVAIFAIANRNFFTLTNLKTMLEQNAALAVVAIGMTFAIISRNIDLAPGSLIAFSGVIAALVFTATGSIYLGLLCGVLAAILVDVFNGFMIAGVGIDPLIVTLAAWIYLRGLSLALAKTFTGSNTVVIQDPFVSFMGSDVLGISPPIVLIGLAYLFGWFVLNKTKLGRYTYAIGGDERAAIQAGVNTRFYKLLMFGVLGLLAGVGMIITLGRLGASASEAATGVELDAIVAVIIGGNAFQGGEGTLRRTAIGVLFIAILNNGLSTMGMRDAYFFAFKGSAILLALMFEVLSRQLLKGEVGEIAAQPVGA